MMAESYNQIDTVIVGMGQTGLSCARHLSGQGVCFAMTDSREKPPMLAILQREFPGTHMSVGRLDESLLLQAGTILLSPGVSPAEKEIAAAAQSGAEIIGDIELFCRHARAPVIAITGSNGKSTVTTLVAEMCNAAGRTTAVGGNLGTPALDLLQEDVDVYVLELSSFQLETLTSLNAVAAVVLNISEDHMDRYDSLQRYTAAKARIYRGDGVMILNRDDLHVMSMRQEGRTTVTYGLSTPAPGDYGISLEQEKSWLVCGNEKIINTDELLINGAHNHANALAAVALADVMQIPRKYSCAVLCTFAGLPHRCQWVADINGVRWVNDSKGTNVGATCAAVSGLARQKNIILLAGGDGKGADFYPLADIAKNYLCAAVLIGRDAPRLRRVLEQHVPVFDAIALPEAVQAAAGIAHEGDTVLLSPACASLDMFTDYRERGEVFCRAVHDLEAQYE